LPYIVPVKFLLCNGAVFGKSKDGGMDLAQFGESIGTKPTILKPDRSVKTLESA